MRIRIVLALLVLSLLLPSVAWAAKSYGADRFDVDVAVQEDGALFVTEMVVFRFTGGPFDTVYRELVSTETDGVVDIVATHGWQTVAVGQGTRQG